MSKSVPDWLAPCTLGSPYGGTWAVSNLVNPSTRRYPPSIEGSKLRSTLAEPGKREPNCRGDRLVIRPPANSN